ncbi:MAG: transporter substrate-binding domain-containing protein [Rhodospirillales bacterium]|nr:transporter substrate-binding domain-containing protein [Rhodospirillales bacterium]
MPRFEYFADQVHVTGLTYALQVFLKTPVNLVSNMWKKVLVAGFACKIIIPLAVSVASAEPTLKLVYADRLPYYITTSDNRVDGLVAGVVARALDKAGIAYRWESQPPKRQLETIRRDLDRVCSPGWFRNPERETFAKFSDPVYQDLPQIAIIRGDDRAMFGKPTLDALFLNRDLWFGVKQGYSYGAYVDSLISKYAPNVRRSPQDALGMVRMLLARRFDYTLAAPEEFTSLVAQMRSNGQNILAIELKGAPPGNTRYLMCSKKVEDSLLAGFNDALSQGLKLP